MIQWCESGGFVVKNSDATSWHELLLKSSGDSSIFHFILLVNRVSHPSYSTS